MPTEMYFVLFPSVHLPAKFSYKTKIRFEHALPKQTKFSNERKKTNLYGKNKQKILQYSLSLSLHSLKYFYKLWKSH